MWMVQVNTGITKMLGHTKQIQDGCMLHLIVQTEQQPSMMQTADTPYVLVLWQLPLR